MSLTYFHYSTKKSKQTLQLSLTPTNKNYHTPKILSKKPIRLSTITKSILNKKYSNSPNKTFNLKTNSKGPKPKSNSLSKIHQTTNKSHHPNKKTSVSKKAFNAKWKTKKWKKCLKKEKNKTFSSNKGFPSYNIN